MSAKAQEAVAVAVRVRRHDGDVPNYAAADVTISSADMAEMLNWVVTCVTTSLKCL